jgi:hypothetical protein
MSGVDVYGLSERKRHIAGDYSGIHCVPRLYDTCFCETRNNLLNVTDALGTCGRASRATTVPHIEV